MTTDLTPEHTARNQGDDKDLHPEVLAAYRYVESVLDSADVPSSKLGGPLWFSWALREAFLAGCSHYARPTITPIPVSERLPGPGDCAPWPEEPDCDPWCWAARDIDGGWEWTQLGIGHFSSDLGRVWRRRGYTHWLPATALPLPSSDHH